MHDLTPRQSEILLFLQEFIEEAGMPPTRAEIARGLGFRSVNAAEEHLRALQRKGVIELVPGTSRGIRLKDFLREQLGLPLIGRVAAEALYHFDPQRVSLTPVPLVERLRRVEELGIVAVDSLFLAITENGILAVDEAGRELWRISETTYGWRFVGSQDGALWLTDVGGDLIGIDPATGEETSA